MNIITRVVKSFELWLINRKKASYSDFPFDAMRVEIPEKGRPEIVLYSLEVVWNWLPRVIVKRVVTKTVSQRTIFDAYISETYSKPITKAFDCFSKNLPGLLDGSGNLIVDRLVTDKLSVVEKITSEKSFLSKDAEISGAIEVTKKLLANLVSEVCSLQKSETVNSAINMVSGFVSTKLAVELENIRTNFFGVVSDFEGLGRQTILPQGCRLLYQKKDRSLIIIQQDPQLRAINWVDSKTAGVAFNLRKRLSSRRNLAFPYVIFAIRTKRGSFATMNVALAKEPLYALNQLLYKWNLSNVNNQGLVCMGSDIGSGTASEIVDRAIGHFWSNTFNSDWSLDMYLPYRPNGAQLESLREWEELSRTDPNFVLRAPWRDYGTLGLLLESSVGSDTTILENAQGKDSALFDKIANIVRQRMEVAMEEELRKSLPEKIHSVGKYRRTTENLFMKAVSEIIDLIFDMFEKRVRSELATGISETEMSDARSVFCESFYKLLQKALDEASAQIQKSDFAPVKPKELALSGQSKKNRIIILNRPNWEQAEEVLDESKTG